MDTKHKPRLNTQKHTRPYDGYLSTNLVLFLDYKLVRLSKNVIVLSLSDEDAFEWGHLT